MELSDRDSQERRYAIPDGWAWYPLREGISLSSGYHVLARHCNTHGVGTPYLTGPADFPEGQIRHTKYTTHPTTVCRPGDILVTVKGSGSGTLVESDGEYCISRQLMAIQTSEWNPKFLFYSLLQNASRIKAASAGLIPGLSRSDILDQVLPVPGTRSEQQAIAAALSDVDALLAGLDRLITKKRDLKLAAMQQLLTGETRLPGFEGEWKVKRLGELATFHKGKGLPKSALEPYGTEPCIHYGELFTQYGESITKTISRTHTTNDAVRSVANDVLMPTSDVTPSGLAKASCVLFDGVVLGGDILVIRTNPSEVSGTFLSYVIRLQDDQVLRLVTGTTVFHLYGMDMKKFTLKLPLLSEQQAIVAVLSDMDAEIAALEQRRAKTADLKQAMMQELLTGRVRLINEREARHGN